MRDIAKIKSYKLPDLRNLAKELKIEGYYSKNIAPLSVKVLDKFEKLATGGEGEEGE